MHMLVSMYYCIYIFSYGPYGPEIKHYYYYYYYYYTAYYDYHVGAYSRIMPCAVHDVLSKLRVCVFIPSF